MSFKVEELGKSMVKLTIEVAAEEFEKAMETAYQKNKNKLSVQGFRKGKAPRAMIEKMYGAGIFYEDAANELIPDAYEKAAVESGLDIVSRPEIDLVQIEKGKDFIFTATVAVKPEITLGAYKDIEIEKQDVTVAEEEIDAELDRVREQNARIITVEDRPVADGDETVIDFEGFVDGVAFAGGKGEDYKLVIGSHSFIDTFYNVVCASQVSSIFEFGADWKKCLTGMIDAAKEVDEETKKAIQKILRSLIDITGEKAAAELSERAAELAGKATELGEKATGLLEKNRGLGEKAAELTLKKKQYKRKLTLANQKRKAKKKEKNQKAEQE